MSHWLRIFASANPDDNMIYLTASIANMHGHVRTPTLGYNFVFARSLSFDLFIDNISPRVTFTMSRLPTPRLIHLAERQGHATFGYSRSSG